MKKILTVGLFILCFSIFAKAQVLSFLKEPAFKAGEKLDYRLRYGIISAATGQLSVSQTQRNGKNAFQLAAMGKTAGTFSVLYTVKNQYESFINEDNFLPYYYTENIKEGKYTRNDKVTFDQKTRTIVGNKGTFKSTVAQTFDLLSAYYFCRNLDLSSVKEGQLIQMTYFLNDEIASLGITYIGIEKIKTSLGTIECIKFSPAIKPGRIFKKNSQLFLWVTNDGNRIPVKAQVDILIGSVTLELTKASGLKYTLGQRASYSK
ncbi:DUF3108 domain-containing protein [Sphingobacteriaceae bacterium WQ 2009]|uniref:DUF3108 domain-containing protein n=1 Tax=Rhinopithecimicrobium faecis TaxID=2820698 RepID=A0A8T4H8R6_9SPHI|nr:DUF3108 domain-containing protein [Sphingobacteriaceae bacterium WQ 2009]